MTAVSLCVVAVTAVLALQPGRAASATPGLSAVTPARLVDTRTDPGNWTVDGQYEAVGFQPAGSILQFRVAGRGGVPTDASAVMLNLLVVGPADAGYLTVFPCGEMPLSSNVNFLSHDVVSNAALTNLAGDGSVCVYTSAPTHVVVDVTAFVPNGGSMGVVGPVRIFDTRGGGGEITIDRQYEGYGVLAAGDTAYLQVAGRIGVPADAPAVVLNVAVVDPIGAGYVTVFPCGSQPPMASSVNVMGPSVVSNTVITSIGSRGRVCIYTSVDTQIVTDLLGYVPNGGAVEALMPARLLDTRAEQTTDRQFEATGMQPAGTTVELQVTGRGGVPGDARAAMLNITAVLPAGPGYLVAYPCGAALPLSSNLNYHPGEVVSTATYTRIGADGKVCVYTSETTHIIADVQASATDVAEPAQTPVRPPSDPGIPVSGAGRGAGTVGSAAYPVPAGALFVNAQSGSDSASGSQGSPLRTVARAVSVATSGQTIVLRGGSYHEKVEIPAGKRLTIQSYPNEAVWFDGSTAVNGWVQSGSTWVAPWTVEFPHNVSFSVGSHDPGWLLPEYPMAGHPDQVFVDGAALRQVGSAGAVGPGTFYVDDAGDRLIIGTDPAGRSVRASDIDKAFNIQANGSTLQGFGVQRYATPISSLGAIRAGADDITLRDLTVRDNATLGISMRGSRIVVDHVTVTRSGLLGIHGNVADGVRVLSSVISGNNSEHFKGAPTASGLKITKSRDVTLANNEARDNNGGYGLWLDESNVGLTIVNNLTTGNRTGIAVELSQNGTIAGNISLNNQEGIWTYDTGNLRIFNNLLAGNSTQDLLMKQDERRPATWPNGGQDRRWPNYLTDAPWLTRDIVVSNNIFANGGRFNVWAQDIAGVIDADDMNITITGNYFSKRASSGDPRLLMWGNAGGTSLTGFDSVAAMHDYNSNWNNAEAPGSFNIDQMRSSAPHGSAAPIPADIASMLGLASDARQLGPVI